MGTGVGRGFTNKGKVIMLECQLQKREEQANNSWMKIT